MKRFLSSFKSTDKASTECVCALSAGNFDKGIKILQAVADGDKSHDHYQLLAVAHILANRPESAILAIDKALQLSPWCSDSHYLAGRAKVIMEALQFAFVDFSRAVILNNCHGEALFYRAWLLFLNCAYEEAIQDYTRSLENFGKNPAAYHQRGLCFEHLNQPEQAVFDFSKAIELDPSQAEYFFSRGLILASQGKFSSAISDYSQAIFLEPQHSEAHYSRGLLCDELDACDLALVDYSKAIELDSQHSEALFCRGVIYTRQSLYDAALDDFSMALSIDPKHSEALVARGRVYSTLQLYSQAARDFGEAIAIHPLPETLRERATCFKQLGDDENAYSDFSRSLTLSACEE